MKAAWEELGGEFADSKTVLIGDVDCTVHKDTCSKYGVRGYPTIKYFTGATAGDGDKYEGGRDLASLKKFADENLGPSCDNDHRDLCKPEQLTILEEASALTASARAEFIAEKEKLISKAESDFKTGVEELQAKYKQMMDDKDKLIADITPTLRLYRSVKDGDKEEL